MPRLRTATNFVQPESRSQITEQIGSYRLIRRLRGGRSDHTFLGERVDDDFEHKVAIKIIRNTPLNAQARRLLRQERNILARLNHPNVVRLLNGGETSDGSPYIIMEHVMGKMLDQWNHEMSPSYEQRLDVFQQICSAMVAAHKKNINLRDLGPANILVSENNQAKILDFSKASMSVAEEEPTRAKGDEHHLVFSLTPGFVAPECYSRNSFSTLSDIYSLGKLLDFLFAGDEGVGDLRAIAAWAARKDPCSRYQNVTELAEDIDRHRRGYPIVSRRREFGHIITRFLRCNGIAAGPRKL